MFRPSPARDVSTCLRCHLSLLRQIRSRHPQRRHQSTDQDPPLIRYTDGTEQSSSGSQGRIRGRKGQRRVASAEPLTIKSLGKSSEVIVLRDLPKEPKRRINRDNQDADNQEESEEQPDSHTEVVTPALTAKDIENFSTKKAPRALLSEVFEAIESVKPDYSGFVLTKVEFEEKSVALMKGFDIGQLRGYLYTVSKSTTQKAGNRLSKKDVEVTEISVSTDDLKTLRRTAWHPGTTRVDVRLPLERSVERQIQMGRKMNRKQFVVEAILREAWGIMVEEEEATIGEMDLLLTPLQFGLLLTKNSNNLRPLLESSKFYQNSRFQLYQPHRVIRIIGPRAEAEAIASVLGDSFAPTRSAEIDLTKFHTLVEESNHVDLEDVFNTQKLKDIMELTRTYIEYDAESRKVNIASFLEVAINDAHRLLMSLLPLPSRHKTRTLYDGLDGGDRRMEGAPTTRNLSFRSKYQDLGRWVTASHKNNERFVDRKLAKTGRPEDVPELEKVEPQPLLESDRPIFQKALEILNTNRTARKGGKQKLSSYWHSGSRVTSWKARFGHLLHERRNDPYPSGESVKRAKDTSRSDAIFSSQTPHLFGLISTSQHITPTTSLPKGHKEAKNAGNKRSETVVELVAHLIPSFLEGTSTLASTALPHIELGFEIENQLFKGTRSILKSDTEAARIGPATQARFKGLRAILDHDILELNLPSQPTDLRFERRHTLVSLNAQRDPNISAFATAIQKSMSEDSSLRAPPALQLRIPKWAVRVSKTAEDTDAEKLRNTDLDKAREIPVKYLFAGFEHRERRNLRTEAASDHILRLETVEAGVTGGRRLEVSLVDDGKDDTENNGEAILRDAVSLVNQLTRIQRGEVKKYFSRDLAKDLHLRDKEKDRETQGAVGDVVFEEGEREERDDVEWGDERESEQDTSLANQEQHEGEIEQDSVQDDTQGQTEQEPEQPHEPEELNKPL